MHRPAVPGAAIWSVEPTGSLRRPAGKATIVFVLAGCICFFALVRVYSSSSKTRKPARAGGIMALLAGAALVGTALTPQDRLPELHGQITLLMVGSFPIATLLLTMATAQDPRFRRRAPVCWLALTIIVIAWASAMLSIRPSTSHELAIPVTLQKVVGIALLATLVLEATRRNESAEILRQTAT